MNKIFPNGVLTVFGESRQGFGEDSVCYSCFEDSGLIAVFDGCGGLGARQYQKMKNLTGAYIASRLVSKTTFSWYERNHPSVYDGENIIRLGEEIQNSLQQAKTVLSAEKGILMLGSMVRTLPTTLAAAIVEPTENHSFSVRFIWAGDSRGFVLSSRGLVQVTQDDLVGSPDAMENIFADAPMSNTVNADQAVKLSHTYLQVTDPCILFTATDGAFGYFHSPMDFEFFLLDTLLQVNSFFEWEKKLDAILRQVAADDYSMVFMPCGYSSFREMKLSLKKRKLYIENQYIEKMDAYVPRNKENMIELWNQYKSSYYGR